MAANTNNRAHVKHGSGPAREGAKPRRPKHRSVDKFYGNIDGFIGEARNKGELVAYSETVYYGDVPVKQPRVPGNLPPPVCEIVH
jgi:hypothetical protein